jgi:catechol 2,3-dioxygenase-like lactoylglutathione lyase family enzyme
MKRFHVHVSVDDLAANVGFYSAVFGMPPTVTRPDYAKWMLDDPRVNFAISQRGGKAGLNHLGLQVDSEPELATLRAQVANAGIAAIEQAGAACCYATSDKYWTRDPQGIAWEAFHTLDSIPVFGDSKDVPDAAATGGCCVPTTDAAPASTCTPKPKPRIRLGDNGCAPDSGCC